MNKGLREYSSLRKLGCDRCSYIAFKERFIKKFSQRMKEC